jgi:hypothetical protein
LKNIWLSVLIGLLIPSWCHAASFVTLKILNPDLYKACVSAGVDSAKKCSGDDDKSAAKCDADARDAIKKKAGSVTVESSEMDQMMTEVAKKVSDDGNEAVKALTDWSKTHNNAYSYVPPGPQNPHDMVTDVRLRILGNSENYCMMNGILMVGSQFTACCDAAPISAGMIIVKTMPGNIGALPKSTCGVGPTVHNNNNSTAPTPNQITDQIAEQLAQFLPSNMKLNDAPVSDTGIPLAGASQSNANAGGTILVPKAAAKGGDVSNKSQGLVGSAFTGGGGSGATASDSPVSTDLTGDSPDKVAAATAGETVEGLAYGGRGGHGSAPSKGGFGKFGGSIRGSGGTQSETFGDQAGSEGNAMMGDDPEDYFTRINLGDSIFVIVHKRYDVKARSTVLDVK